MAVEIEKKVRLTVSTVSAYAVSSIFTAFLVIAKEEAEGIKNWLYTTFSHHWIGHAIVTLIVFFLVLFITYSTVNIKELTPDLEDKLVYTSIFATVIAFLLIAGYFLMHIL